MKFSPLTRSSAAALAVTALLATHGASAAQIETSQLPALKTGMNTAQITRQLGAPGSKIVWLNGSSTWRYETENWNQHFDVDLDPNGKLLRAGVHESASTGNV